MGYYLQALFVLNFPFAKIRNFQVSHAHTADGWNSEEFLDNFPIVCTGRNSTDVKF